MDERRPDAKIYQARTKQPAGGPFPRRLMDLSVEAER